MDFVQTLTAVEMPSDAARRYLCAFFCANDYADLRGEADHKVVCFMAYHDVDIAGCRARGSCRLQLCAPSSHPPQELARLTELVSSAAVQQ